MEFAERRHKASGNSPAYIQLTANEFRRISLLAEGELCGKPVGAGEVHDPSPCRREAGHSGGHAAAPNQGPFRCAGVLD